MSPAALLLNYLVAVIWSTWFAVLGTIAAVVEFAGYIVGRSWELPKQRYRIPLLLVLLFLAQFMAYRELYLVGERANLDHASQVAQLARELSQQKAIVAGQQRQLQLQQDHIEQLRTAAVRAPVPVDVRVSSVPQPGMLPSFVIAGDEASTYWSDAAEWTNPSGAYDEVTVDWEAVPAETNALAELRAVVLSQTGGSAQIRIIDVATGKAVATSTEIKGVASAGSSQKVTLLIPAATGRRKYVVQFRTTGQTSVNLRGNLVFERAARWQ